MKRLFLVRVVLVRVLARVAAEDVSWKIALFLGKTEGQQLRLLACDGRFAADRYSVLFTVCAFCVRVILCRQQ